MHPNVQYVIDKVEYVFKLTGIIPETEEEKKRREEKEKRKKEERQAQRPKRKAPLPWGYKTKTGQFVPIMPFTIINNIIMHPNVQYIIDKVEYVFKLTGIITETEKPSPTPSTPIYKRKKKYPRMYLEYNEKMFGNKYKLNKKRKHGFQKMHHSKGFYVSQNKAKLARVDVIGNTLYFWYKRFGIINYWYLLMVNYYHEQRDILKVTLHYLVLVIKSFFV